MATESIQVSGGVRAPPDRIYEAWLDSAEHSAMTGGRATIDANVGGRFTAWDGYIEGATLELEPGRRILQRWRTSEFPPGAADSLVEIRLEPLEEGTRIIFLHSEIPEGQRTKYEQGWREHYLDPMDRYFAAATDEDEDDIEDDDDEDVEIAIAAKPKAPPKPPAQKAAPAKAAPKAPAKKAAAKRPAKKAAAKSTKKAAAKRAGKKASPKKKSAKKAKKASARKASKKSARKGKSAKRSAKRGR